MTASPYEDRRDAAIAWLMGRINYERAPIPYGEQALRLEGVRELLTRLGNPDRGLRIVHIAGTKGKGSTGAMIAAALEAAGLRTGVYSSPHLDRLEERFAVGGEPCRGEELASLVDRLRPVAEELDSDAENDSSPHAAGPTFFDLTTAAALLHFADREVDAVVLEVGLGGRLDSTNIVTPAVSVITSISLDHTRQLGATRDLIAAEKAGIIKPGMPIVSGVADAEAGDVIERIAAERGAPLWRRDRDFAIEPDGEAWQFWRRSSAGEERLDNVRPALPGAAQATNAAVALATLGVLADAGWALPEDARRHGVAHGRLPARMERFPGTPLVVIDGAHNDASAAALAEAVDTLTSGTDATRRVLLIAVSDDKDVGAILRPLVSHFAAVVATRFLDNPRAIDPESLGQAARDAGATCVIVQPDPAAAYAEAKRLAGDSGAVVATGSLLFAAEARRLVLADTSR